MISFVAVALNCVHLTHTERVDVIIKEGKRVTVNEILTKRVIKNNALQEIIESLGYKNVCACWISGFIDR